MAAEKNTQIPEEVRKRMYEAFENYYDKSDNRMEAVNDNDLDGISGGVYSEGQHKIECLYQINNNTYVIQYRGTDLCSKCGITQLGSRFLEFTNEGRTVSRVLCQTCALEEGYTIYL